MIRLQLLALVLGSLLLQTTTAPAASAVRLFDGKTFHGWEGETNKTWRIEAGALVGGSLKENVPHNEFLVATRPYTNFVLRLKFKLTGTEGFVNAGIQIHSQRISNPPYEMTGYQADMGDGWWGSLYDESRRNKVLAKADPAVIDKIIKRGDWNEYEIRAEGRRIRLSINGTQTVDYTETDPAIPLHGHIGLQVHGGGKAEASYKDIEIVELPSGN